MTAAPENLVRPLKRKLSNSAINRRKLKKAKFIHSKGQKMDPEFMSIGTEVSKVIPKVNRTLPLWLQHPEVVTKDIPGGSEPLESVPQLDSRLCATLREQGITKLFPVQRAIIPKVLSEQDTIDICSARDLCIAAATGSGKTLAYALPLLQVLHAWRCRNILALVLVPDAHLADQVATVFKTYSKKLLVKVGSAYSYTGFQKEQAELTRAMSDIELGFEPTDRTHVPLVHAVVGTPARVRYHMKMTPGFDLSYLRFLVLDEVSSLLASDEGPWISTLIHHIKTEQSSEKWESWGVPQPLRFQKILVSATLTNDPEKLCSLDLYVPVLYKSTGSSSVRMSRPPSLKEKYVTINIPVQPLALHHLIIRHRWNRVLVFHSTRKEVRRLVLLLKHLSNGAYTVEEFNSKVAAKPKKIEDSFNKGEIDVLVATDSLAQGADLRQVDVVVNYTCPASMETYVHRCGRTARAGKAGLAVTLLPVDKNRKAFVKMAKKSGSVKISCLVLNPEELDQYSDLYQEAKERLKIVLDEEKLEASNDVKSIRKKSKKKGLKNIS